MQRKIQEAEEAKKRLAALKVRAAKRTAAGANAGAGKLPSGSMSSLSGSVSRTGSTPIAAITAGAPSASDSIHAAKGGHPSAAESDPGAVKDTTAESGGVAGVQQQQFSCHRRPVGVLGFAWLGLPQMALRGRQICTSLCCLQASIGQYLQKPAIVMQHDVWCMLRFQVHQACRCYFWLAHSPSILVPCKAPQAYPCSVCDMAVHMQASARAP